ncbi:TRAP transporter small permease [Variovorax defluvii]|uniref:TRAP transporter small permease protein n=1 Tax=Variovorax defluvii TaxID=913761 RepID=A0ABP8I0U7_9BURK
MAIPIGEMQPAREARRPSRILKLALFIPECLSAATLGLLVLFLVISVVSRYAIDVGLPWSDELARLLFAWIVLVGFAIAVRHRANVGVDWLVNKLPRRGRLAVAMVQDFIVLAFSMFFTWEAWVTVGFSMMQRMPALDITIAWMYGSALAGGVLMIIYALANFIDTLQGRIPVSHIEAEMMRAE